jgi:hypothetical protein
MSTNHTSLLPLLYSFRRMEELAKPQLCWSMCGIGKGSRSYGLWRVLASILGSHPPPHGPNHTTEQITIAWIPQFPAPGQVTIFYQIQPGLPSSLSPCGAKTVAALKPVSWLSPVAGAVSRSSGCTCGFTLMLASCELAFALAYGPLQPIQRERPEHLSLTPRPVILSHS